MRDDFVILAPRCVACFFAMRLDLSINDLELIERGLQRLVSLEDEKLASERKKKAPTAEDRDYAQYVEERVSTAKATLPKVRGAVTAAKRLTAISVEIRPPDATFASKPQALHPSYRFDLSIGDFDMITNGLMELISELAEQTGRRRKEQDIAEQMERRTLQEARDLFPRVHQLYEALRRSPVACVDVDEKRKEPPT